MTLYEDPKFLELLFRSRIYLESKNLEVEYTWVHGLVDYALKLQAKDPFYGIWLHRLMLHVCDRFSNESLWCKFDMKACHTLQDWMNSNQFLFRQAEVACDRQKADELSLQAFDAIVRFETIFAGLQRDHLVACMILHQTLKNRPVLEKIYDCFLEMLRIVGTGLGACFHAVLLWLGCVARPEDALPPVSVPAYTGSRPLSSEAAEFIKEAVDYARERAGQDFDDMRADMTWRDSYKADFEVAFTQIIKEDHPTLPREVRQYKATRIARDQEQFLRVEKGLAVLKQWFAEARYQEVISQCEKLFATASSLRAENSTTLNRVGINSVSSRQQLPSVVLSGDVKITNG
ncbi:MAG: hypothetical protein NXI01_02140 [Gammaproteobacteria bacterium]|nr:hypothetical protein [Gammaproteobacteria bacterium]